MSDNQPIQFDLDTVLFLRETLDDAWACLRPAQRATTTRSELAERILKTAARGERNKERLVDAAVAPIAA